MATKASLKIRRHGWITAALTVLIVLTTVLLNATVTTLSLRYDWYVNMNPNLYYPVTDTCFAYLDEYVIPDAKSPIRLIFCDDKKNIEADMTMSYVLNTATELQPLLMGILVSVVVGIILTLPISSAAICAMIGITGLAGGAATAGCCAQMIGFAVISFRENKWSGLVAQGLGTSMLQMGNIVKNPRIWIPATLAAAITGPLSTLVFKLQCTGVSAGMGTCGLVGPLGVLKDMNFSATAWIGVIVTCIVAPALLSLLFSEILRKIGWIKAGDMKLNL